MRLSPRFSVQLPFYLYRTSASNAYMCIYIYAGIANLYIQVYIYFFLDFRYSLFGPTGSWPANGPKGRLNFGIIRTDAESLSVGEGSNICNCRLHHPLPPASILHFAHKYLPLWQIVFLSTADEHVATAAALAFAIAVALAACHLQLSLATSQAGGLSGCPTGWLSTWCQEVRNALPAKCSVSVCF